MIATAENKQEIVRQVRRLSAKPYAPKDVNEPEAIELCRVLLECAEDTGHAKVLIDAILAEEGSYPEPARLRRMARESKQFCQRPDPTHEECGGSGYVSVKRGAYAYAVRCTCWASRPVQIMPWEGSIESPNLAKEAKA